MALVDGGASGRSENVDASDESHTIAEARRLLRQLITTGQATLSNKRVIEPKDDLLVQLIEKHASRKLVPTELMPVVEGFEPKATYHSKETPDAGAQEGDEVAR
jgi:hypothetical protein